MDLKKSSTPTKAKMSAHVIEPLVRKERSDAHHEKPAR